MTWKTSFIVLTLMLITNICSAVVPVRISDYGCDGFYYRFNEVAQEMKKSNMIIKKMPQKSMSNDNYDTYICGNGSIGHGTTISLFANKEGYVSKIMIVGTASDSVAMNNLGENLVLILATLGVNKGEMSVFVDSWRSNNNIDARRWCSAANRFIIVNGNMDYNYNMFSVTFTAAA